MQKSESAETRSSPDCVLLLPMMNKIRLLHVDPSIPKKKAHNKKKGNTKSTSIKKMFRGGRKIKQRASTGVSMICITDITKKLQFPSLTDDDAYGGGSNDDDDDDYSPLVKCLRPRTKTRLHQEVVVVDDPTIIQAPSLPLSSSFCRLPLLPRRLEENDDTITSSHSSISSSFSLAPRFSDDDGNGYRTLFLGSDEEVYSPTILHMRDITR